MIGVGKRRPQRQRTALTRSIPAAIGGWNARDSIAAMPETDAVTLINWFPTPSRCELRGGYLAWSTGYAAQVETLALYSGATDKLFAFSGTSIFDATAQGAVGAAVVAGLSNARWITTNFTTTGGVRYLVCVNGVDSMRVWDGAAWTLINGVSAPAITGIVTSTISYVCSHKSRLWFVKSGTMEVYYQPTGALGGAASLFDLRPVFKKGGTIVAMCTWSIDGGYGLDDQLVFMSSNGEVAIYHGTDPSSASTWALVGVYEYGAPLGTRCMQKYGGDILLITFDGLMPLSQTLASSRVTTQTSITDKILDAMGTAANTYFANYGWQVTNAPIQNALILNVPVGVATGLNEQYVMNTITGAWTRFQGWNAACWENWKDAQFFGGTTYVAKAWVGNSDGTAKINTDYQAAFSYFDDRGGLKQWTMARPILSTDGAPGIAYGLNVDFDQNDPTGSPTFVATTSGVWDSSVWDTGIWGGGLTLQKSWQYVSGLGYCASFRMKTQSAGIQIQLAAIDYVYKSAGIL
jgi:hypothetical protein